MQNALTAPRRTANSILSSFKGNLPPERPARLAAFVNTPVSKEQLLTSLRTHQRADRFLNDHYWDNYRKTGCAVGCSIHDFAPGRENDHLVYEELFGISLEAAMAQDIVFSHMNTTSKRHWPIDFIEAVPQGADLSDILTPWILKLMTDPRSPVANHHQHPAFVSVREMYQHWADSGVLNPALAAAAADTVETALEAPNNRSQLDRALTCAWASLEYAGSASGLPDLPTLPMSRYREDLVSGVGFIFTQAAEAYATGRVPTAAFRHNAWRRTGQLLHDTVAEATIHPG